MNLAPRDQVGLALGAWGAIQATAAGIGVALSGVLRDLIAAMTRGQLRCPGPAVGGGWLHGCLR